MPDKFELGDRIAYAFEYGEKKKKKLVLHGGTVKAYHPQLTKTHNQVEAKSDKPKLGKMYTIIFDPVPEYGYEETVMQSLFYDSLYGAEEQNSWIHCSNIDTEAAAYFNDMCRTTPSKTSVSIFIVINMLNGPYSKSSHR
jgi:hypothetical protein